MRGDTVTGVADRDRHIGAGPQTRPVSLVLVLHHDVRRGDRQPPADELQAVTRSEVLKFSAGGFRDFTRIAASDPTMWRDIFLANKDGVLEMLGRFNEDVAALTKAIRKGDGEALFEHFTRTRAIRRGIIEAGQDTPAPDFGRPHGHDD